MSSTKEARCLQKLATHRGEFNTGHGELQRFLDYSIKAIDHVTRWTGGHFQILSANLPGGQQRRFWDALPSSPSTEVTRR